ncbi:MAG: hypothetical protein IT324_26945 [Anaerolineae bacterium]|nr:hypothetical protein [Anaerolineae bacterium]
MNKVAIRLSIIATLLFILVAALPVVQAQGDTNTIEYGKTVKGEITNEAFEVSYKFAGEAQDVVVIRMERDGTTGGIGSPDVILLDSKNKIVADSTRISEAILALELPAQDTYTVIATRQGGRTGKSVGKFALSLIKPEKLIPDTPTKGKISVAPDTESVENFYVLDGGAPFKIAFERQGGKVTPSVTVDNMDKNGPLIVGVLYGRDLTDGVIGVAATAPGKYLVRVGVSRSLINALSRATAEPAESGDIEYTLTLTVKK